MRFSTFTFCPFRFAAVSLALVWGGLGGSLRAQDRLVFKDNHVQDGRIVGVKDGAVAMEVPRPRGAPGQMAFNLGLLARVDAPPPPAFQTGLTAYNAGDWDRALASVKPLAETFRGLPTSWAQAAAAMLGDLYVEKNDLPRAEAAYNDYRRFYPPTRENSVRFSLGQARIAFARHNATQARTLLEPLAAVALKNPADASRADAATYGQVFYLLGQIQEGAGDFQAAVEDYLRTTTLFYQDNAVAVRAQKGADDLRAAHKGLVAP